MYEQTEDDLIDDFVFDNEIENMMTLEEFEYQREKVDDFIKKWFDLDGLTTLTLKAYYNHMNGINFKILEFNDNSFGDPVVQVKKNLPKIYFNILFKGYKKDISIHINKYGHIIGEVDEEAFMDGTHSLKNSLKNITK